MNSDLFKEYKGFTIMELLVVLSIMGLLFTFVLVNIGGKRGARNLRLAQSGLVSDIRKIQSFTLSSRNVPGGNPTQYNLIKFDMNTPDRYYIQAIYDKATAPNGNGRMKTIETIYFPPGVKFDISAVAPSYPVKIVRPNNPPPDMNLSATDCGLLAFKAPFAKTFMSKGCSAGAEPYDIVTGDDYSRIVNFMGDVDNVSKLSTMIITLRENQTNLSKTVTVQASNGLATFSQ
jgi:prepilin-type N-terminal cleavage/methylation domain-containing protein